MTIRRPGGCAQNGIVFRKSSSRRSANKPSTTRADTYYVRTLTPGTTTVYYKRGKCMRSRETALWM